MAGIIANINTAKIALAAATAAGVLQLTAPTNQRVKILRWGVFLDEKTGDLTPANPLLVEAGKQTGATGGTAITPQRLVTGNETLQTSGLVSVTGGTLTPLDSAVVNPQTFYEVIFPLGQELVLSGGEIFGIRVTPGAVISTDGLNVVAKVWFEE